MKFISRRGDGPPHLNGLIYLSLGDFEHKSFFMAHGVVVSTSGFHRGDRGSKPDRAVKFDIANLCIKRALRQ